MGEHRIERIRMNKGDLQLETLRVLGCNGQSSLRDVAREHFGIRPPVLDGQCDGAAARTHIEHPRDFQPVHPA